MGLSLPGRQIASDNVSAFATGGGHDGDVQIACMKLQEVSVQGCMPRTGLPGAAARGGLPRRSYRRRPRRTSGAATRGGLPGRIISWEVHHQGDGGMRCRIHSWEVHHQGDGVPRLGAPWPVRCWEVHHQGDGGKPRRIYSWEVHHQGDGVPVLRVSMLRRFRAAAATASHAAAYVAPPMGAKASCATRVASWSSRGILPSTGGCALVMRAQGTHRFDPSGVWSHLAGRCFVVWTHSAQLIAMLSRSVSSRARFEAA